MLYYDSNKHDIDNLPTIKIKNIIINNYKKLIKNECKLNIHTNGDGSLRYFSFHKSIEY